MPELLEEAIDLYMDTVAGLSLHTQTSYRDKLRVFSDFCTERSLDLSDVTPKVFRAFIEWIAERRNQNTGEKIAGHTISSYGRVVKIFLRWVSTEEDYAGTIKPSSLRSMAVPKLEKKVKPTLSPAEIDRLYLACDRERYPSLVVRDKAILSMLLDTGIRVSELCSLTIGHVYFDQQDPHVTVYGKGKKERTVGLGHKARADLHRYIRKYRNHAREQETVFINRSGNQLTRNGLDQILYRLKDWAEVNTEGGAHLFRHTYATMYLRAGGNVFNLSLLMGHEHVSTTQGYALELMKEDARRELSVLDQLQKKGRQGRGHS